MALDLGPHVGFILSSYGVTALVVAVLAGWIIRDGRALRRRLAELERQGIRRRSSAGGEAA